jgi:hypothetical protein
MATTKTVKLRILIAHPDAEWVGQAKERLLKMGYAVTDCLELEWAADLLTGSRVFDLAAISSEMDPAGQAAVLKSMREGKCTTKLLLLLDQLDSASISIRKQTGIPTFRISKDIHEFALAVAAQVGVPSRPPI